MSKHPNAQQAIEYWTDALTMDKPWEGWEIDHIDINGYNGNWVPMHYHPDFTNRFFKFRRKPKTININGFEVPEPLREFPEDGTLIYKAVLDEDGGWLRCNYSKTSAEHQALIARGICHLAGESAALQSKALLSFTKREE
jgi:hypothetical protein